jgi:hypothetical protein
LKPRTLMSILILVFAMLIMMGSCATSKKAYVAKEDEELFGIWINFQYDGTNKYSKVQINPDGTWFEYINSYDEKPPFRGEYTIIEKWTDSEGYIYYKTIVERNDVASDPLYILSKIQKDGNVYEDIWTTLHMPEEFDTEKMLYLYRIYYRQ